jgi:hypothetical protein
VTVEHSDATSLVFDDDYLLADVHRTTTGEQLLLDGWMTTAVRRLVVWMRRSRR